MTHIKHSHICVHHFQTLFIWCNCFICVKIRSFYSNNMHSFFFIETYLKAKIHTGIYSLTCIKQSPLGQRVVLNSHIWDKGLYWTVSLGQRVVLNSHIWDKGLYWKSPLGQRVLLNSHLWDKGLYWTVTIGTKGCIEQSPLGQCYWTVTFGTKGCIEVTYHLFT